VPRFPALSPDAIARLSLAHLQAVVAIDSASDERSDAIPSTPGQLRLSEVLEGFFREAGAEVERDDYANLIATLPGRGAGAGAPPLALMVHLVTARGTHAVERLEVLEGWDGQEIPYPANRDIWVDLPTYPTTGAFLGHDLVHGPGDAPFGLDDKLGLTHLMTLARLLADHPDIPHPPLIVIARPDEEIGRHAAVEGLAALLAERGVRSGYTIDGIHPFEINVENFNAAQASVRFEDRPASPPEGRDIAVRLRGVNTHGATARAEGHRSAVRLASELLVLAESRGLFPEKVYPLSIDSDPERDCDATLTLRVADAASLAALDRAVEEVMRPHIRRGAGWDTAEAAPVRAPSTAAVALLRWVNRFLASDPGFPLAAEDSDGRHGYSHPFRALRDGDGLRLDVRLRDFTPEGLGARKAHVRGLAAGMQVSVVDQYVNMGPRLVDRPELVERAAAAGAEVRARCPIQPIRGGTGVDPFLDRGIAVANLGTGYFAPESEKEFTSLQLMTRHALWLIALVQQFAG
jgi:di/tripeptidase